MVKKGGGGGMVKSRSRAVMEKKSEKGVSKTGGSPKNVTASRLKQRQRRKKVGKSLKYVD